jgi:hypothetical protein
MNKIKFLFFIFLMLSSYSMIAQKFIFDANSTQVKYAVGRIKKAVENKNKIYQNEWSKREILMQLDSQNLKKEAYQLTIENKKITIKGGDFTGIIYGALSLAEDIRDSRSPATLQSKSESPQYTFRAIKYDLPWDSYRHSEALDLHIETCKDLKYWEKYLDMMVESRFNVLTIWNLHPYTYMIKPKNFPEASPFTDAELAVWQKLFHGILGMAEERGIETYLMPFNIFVSPEFAKAHNVAMDNLGHHHIGKGDTSAIIKTYTRECVTQVLQEYPELDGFCITLGEVVGGMTPTEREDWVHETIYEGMRLSGRKAKLIHRIPFSANLNPGGSTSKETEEITRKILESDGSLDYLQSPIMADLKYNWSHGHSTPKLVKVHGGKLYDTYFKPNPTQYKIVWTIRNEDFFCLRWGSPEFIKAHIAENSQDFMGGYMIGSETYIPAKDYFTKNATGVNWTYAFERQWLFYKTWGRLLYNPKTPDAVFENEFTNRFWQSGKSLFEAYKLASNTPLTLASFFDFGWDFTLYSEGFLALNQKTGNVEFINIDRLINRETLDPDYVSIKDFVAAQMSKKAFEEKKMTPPKIAQKLENESKKALDLVKNIDFSNNPTIMYEVADIKIWSNLGLYLSEKINGGIALETYRKTGNETQKTKAIKHLEVALNYWNKVVEISSPLYKEMPLVHFSEQKNMSQEAKAKLRFHWSLLRNDVLKDVEMAQNAVVEK